METKEEKKVLASWGSDTRGHGLDPDVVPVGPRSSSDDGHGSVLPASAAPRNAFADEINEENESSQRMVSATEINNEEYESTTDSVKGDDWNMLAAQKEDTDSTIPYFSDTASNKTASNAEGTMDVEVPSTKRRHSSEEDNSEESDDVRVKTQKRRIISRIEDTPSSENIETTTVEPDLSDTDNISEIDGKIEKMTKMYQSMDRKVKIDELREEKEELKIAKIEKEKERKEEEEKTKKKIEKKELAEINIMEKISDTKVIKEEDYIDNVPSSLLAASVLEYIDELEIIRVKSGSMQGRLSKSMKERTDSISHIIRTLAERAEESGDPKLLKAQVQSLLKENKEKEEKRRKEIKDLNESVLKLSKENEKMKEDLKYIRSSIEKSVSEKRYLHKKRTPKTLEQDHLKKEGNISSTEDELIELTDTYHTYHAEKSLDVPRRRPMMSRTAKEEDEPVNKTEPINKTEKKTYRTYYVRKSHEALCQDSTTSRNVQEDMLKSQDNLLAMNSQAMRPALRGKVNPIVGSEIKYMDKQILAKIQEVERQKKEKDKQHSNKDKVKSIDLSIVNALAYVEKAMTECKDPTIVNALACVEEAMRDKTRTCLDRKPGPRVVSNHQLVPPRDECVAKEDDEKDRNMDYDIYGTGWEDEGMEVDKENVEEGRVKDKDREEEGNKMYGIGKGYEREKEEEKSYIEVSRSRGKSKVKQERKEVRNKESVRKLDNKKLAKRIIRKTPKTAAVSIKGDTSQGFSYAEILKKARSNINMEDLEISGPKIRKGLNGATIIEIAGPECSKKAQVLAAKLQEVLKNDKAAIRTPMIKGDIRLIGFDESVDKDDIGNVITKAGECEIKDVRIGEIRKTRRGSGIVWIQCPLRSAIKIANIKKIRIGWSTANVTLLKARPLQCYRCWLYGHVKEQCREMKDRSKCCFRCGREGHKVLECNSALMCIVCKDLGRECAHRVGSAKCTGVIKKNQDRMSTETDTVLISEDTNNKGVDIDMKIND